MVNLRWCLIAAFFLTACDGLTTDTERRRPVETDTREDAADTGAPRDTEDDDTGDDTNDTGALDTGADTGTDADTGDTEVGQGNRCGGESALDYRGLAASPAASCGICDDGLLYCAAPDELRCAGALPANGCGGCGQLPALAGESCGICDDGRWACGGGQLSCIGDGPTNACGGCAPLEVTPGASCLLTGGEAGVAA